MEVDQANLAHENFLGLGSTWTGLTYSFVLAGYPEYAFNSELGILKGTTATISIFTNPELCFEDKN